MGTKVGAGNEEDRMMNEHHAKQLVASPQNRCLTENDMQALNQYILQNLHDLISINELAGVLGIDEEALDAALMRRWGACANLYILRLKAAIARQLSNAPNACPDEVARKAGFASKSHMKVVLKSM